MIIVELYCYMNKPKCQNLLVLNSSMLTSEDIVGFNSTPSIRVYNVVSLILWYCTIVDDSGYSSWNNFYLYGPK
jgi:hypothetical protein